MAGRRRSVAGISTTCATNSIFTSAAELPHGRGESLSVPVAGEPRTAREFHMTTAQTTGGSAIWSRPRFSTGMQARSAINARIVSVTCSRPHPRNVLACRKSVASARSRCRSAAEKVSGVGCGIDGCAPGSSVRGGRRNRANRFSSRRIR